MIDCSAVQCLLDILVSDCTPLELVWGASKLRVSITYAFCFVLTNTCIAVTAPCMYVFLAIMQRSQVDEGSASLKACHACSTSPSPAHVVCGGTLKAPVIQHFKFRI